MDLEVTSDSFVFKVLLASGYESHILIINPLQNDTKRITLMQTSPRYPNPNVLDSFNSFRFLCAGRKSLNFKLDTMNLNNCSQKQMIVVCLVNTPLPSSKGDTWKGNIEKNAAFRVQLNTVIFYIPEYFLSIPDMVSPRAIAGASFCIRLFILCLAIVAMILILVAPGACFSRYLNGQPISREICPGQNSIFPMNADRWSNALHFQGRGEKLVTSVSITTFIK
ncbi:hypothetical protein DICVIV_11950 [Dictyocaulus viviparus]|uniref:Uncharacterized protein n=1 Tax=Dictyocaulus viviparus TaxID=29172 RepID=A0A0D8XBR7_DICVI|nr:hypothetical protein DICVIV_11950 [Dictyocaulus viviparus]